MSINRVTISGNLTRDPEVRTTQSGMPVMNIGVAVNERRKNNQTGEWEDYPNFVDCTMFGSRAEKVSGYISKGSKVCIEGKLRYSQWTDKQTGGNRSKLGVIVDEIEFMSRNQSGTTMVSVPVLTAEQAVEVAQSNAPVQVSVYDEDIPF